MDARRNQVLAAMEGRPEQARKGRVADEFDAVVLVISAGCRGWKAATPDDVFDSLCCLDTQHNGTNMLHEIYCSCVRFAGNDACPEGSLCANIMRPILSEKGFVS